MLHCLPQCPTVRRQLREEVRKAGWTDEYLRKVIDAHPVDIGEDLDPPKIYRKVKPGRRKIIHKVPLSPRKQRVTSKDLEHDDRYKEKRQKDYPDKIVQDSIRITDYKEIIDDDDEKPVATLKQETVYYTEKKEVTHVAPLVKRVSPRVIKRPQVQQEREIESPIEDQRLISYEKEKVNDIATTYSRTESESSIEDQKQIDYEKEKVDDIAIISSSAEERPGTSKIVEDRRQIQSRDDSPDSYYKYTPEKLPSDWPHDGCDQNCPAKILKERAEKLLEERQKYMEDRYLSTGLSYFEDVCTCSLGCMVHNLKKDRFVRSILTSAILFAFGIKLCSELYGWYLPNRT